MSVEKKFVRDGYTRASMDEFFAEELGRSGYGGMDLSRTPMGTQVTIYAEKPGMVIGRAGKVIRKLTRDVGEKFEIDNPQINASEIRKSELNAQIMANRLATSIERGWYFRKAGTNTLRAIMGAGALGCEIVISGKLTGARSRVEKFTDGYVKHAGHPSEVIVDVGYAVAVKKLGTIGCKVKIVPPAAVLPDTFEINEIVPPVIEEIQKTEVPTDSGQQVNVKTSVEGSTIAPESSETDDVSVSAPGDQTSSVEAQVDLTSDQADENDEKPGEFVKIGESEIIVVEDSEENEVRRVVDGVWQHKHDNYDYWHPMARVHKEGK